MAEDKYAQPDTLLGKFNRFATNVKPRLMDLLGKDLYEIFEKGNIKQDIPFGVKAKYDFRDRNINLQKKFGKYKDLQLDLNVGRNKALLKLKKEF
jgi:hypothetical protein